jgi:hypothetical protein
MSSEEENLLNAFYSKTAELKNKNEADLTIAERLMLKAESQTRTIQIDGIDIEVKVLPQVALKEIAKIFESGDGDAIIDAIANNVIDESINREFLESGYFTKSQMQQMLFAVVNTSEEEIKQIAEFRKKTDRPKPV